MCGQEVPEQVGPTGLTPAHVTASVSTGPSPRAPSNKYAPAPILPQGSRRLDICPQTTSSTLDPGTCSYCSLLGPASQRSLLLQPRALAGPCLPESEFPEDVEMAGRVSRPAPRARVKADSCYYQLLCFPSERPGADPCQARAEGGSAVGCHS